MLEKKAGAPGMVDGVELTKRGDSLHSRASRVVASRAVGLVFTCGGRKSGVVGDVGDSLFRS